MRRYAGAQSAGRTLAGTTVWFKIPGITCVSSGSRLHMPPTFRWAKTPRNSAHMLFFSEQSGPPCLSQSTQSVPQPGGSTLILHGPHPSSPSTFKQDQWSNVGRTPIHHSAGGRHPSPSPCQVACSCGGHVSVAAQDAACFWWLFIQSQWPINRLPHVSVMSQTHATLSACP